VWKGVEVIWKASQPKAKESDKKAADNFLQSEDIMPFLPNPEGKTLDELIPSVEDLKKFEEGGTLLERFGEFLVPSAGAAEIPTGETSQLIPNSAVQELQSLDQKSIGTGTGGMLSFNREDILGMPKTVDQVEQFLRQYQTYLAEFGEDQAEELLEAQFQTLDPLAQEEILKILSPDETPIETPTSQIPARFLRDLSDTFKYMITGNPYEEGMFGSQKRRHYGPKF
jgi:hypothetical protein